MIAKRLKDFLDERRIRYITLTHSPAFTAHEVAQSAHISGRALAKTVMVMVHGAPAMAVLPANHRVLLDELADFIGTEDVRLAQEDEFKRHFPDCEPGAMPPFGNLYDMSVYVSPDLADEDEIAFNAGSHTEIIRMSYRDFAQLVKPQVAEFTT